MHEIAVEGQGVPASVYEAVKADMLKWKGRYRDTKARLAELTLERDGLSDQVRSLAAERDSARPDSDKKDARIAELTGQLRSRDHRDAMAGMLKDLNLRTDALDALLTLNQYDPEAHQTADGQPDAARIRAFLGTAASAHPWASASPPAAGGNTSATDVAKGASLTGGKPAGPGVARGGSPSRPPGDPRVAAAEGLRARVGHDNPFKIA